MAPRGLPATPPPLNVSGFSDHLSPISRERQVVERTRPQGLGAARLAYCRQVPSGCPIALSLTNGIGATGRLCVYCDDQVTSCFSICGSYGTLVKQKFSFSKLGSSWTNMVCSDFFFHPVCELLSTSASPEPDLQDGLSEVRARDSSGTLLHEHGWIKAK